MEDQPSSAAASSSSSSSSCKYTGVRKRSWGKYVSEIRLPNSRDRIWLGSYDTAEKAARAFDAAQFCLRGRNSRLNFPNDPPDIVNAGSMTPAEIQAAAARFARAATSSAALSDSFTSIPGSPSPSVSDGIATQVDFEMTELPPNNSYPDQFFIMGTENSLSDFGIFPGFDDLSGEFFLPTLPQVDYWSDYNQELLFAETSSSLWNFDTQNYT